MFVKFKDAFAGGFGVIVATLTRFWRVTVLGPIAQYHRGGGGGQLEEPRPTRGSFT